MIPPIVNDIQTRLYMMYTKLVEETEVGSRVLAMLNEDPRVQALAGKMISHGGGASAFETRILAMWFLWATNEFGQEQAEKSLDDFLTSESLPIMNALWVLGVEIERSLELADGYHIVPIQEMPDSRDKEQYLRHDTGLVHGTPKPKVAITTTCRVPKTMDESPENWDEKEFLATSRSLKEIALLLNALDGIACTPYYSTSYNLPHMPLGMFCGSGGGYPVYDVLGYRSSMLSGEAIDVIDCMRKAFSGFSSREKERMSRILYRLSQAKRRGQIEDKILDLGIALEMALLDDNTNNDQLSLSFRLRGSWLIGEDKDGRLEVFQKLKEIYKYRSQVAHSGILCRNDTTKINLVRDRFAEYELLAAQILRCLILNDKPDWGELVLGSTEQITLRDD